MNINVNSLIHSLLLNTARSCHYIVISATVLAVAMLLPNQLNCRNSSHVNQLLHLLFLFLPVSFNFYTIKKNLLYGRGIYSTHT